MMRNAMWMLSNLCRGKPSPPFELVQSAVPIVAHLVHFTQDEHVLADACWTLSYLSEGSVQAVIEANVVRRVVELLEHADANVQTAVLRIVGNIVSGDDLQTQLVVSIGALQLLHPMLTSEHKAIRKEACWVVSNITAGTVAQIQEVCDAGITAVLAHLMKEDEFAIKKEAAWAVSNATTGGTSAQIRHLVREGVLPPLCDLLSCPEAGTISVALEALDNILAVGEADLATYGMNPYCVMVEETVGLDRLELLQNHVSTQIYERSGTVLKRFFGADGEGEVIPSDEAQAAVEMRLAPAQFQDVLSTTVVVAPTYLKFSVPDPGTEPFSLGDDEGEVIPSDGVTQSAEGMFRDPPASTDPWAELGVSLRRTAAQLGASHYGTAYIDFSAPDAGTEPFSLDN